MQKTSSSSSSNGTDQEISGLQYDPAIQKLFKDAMEVLRLAGADENGPDIYPSSEHHEAQLQRETRREKIQLQQKTEKQAKKQPEITKSKRRKLERIKAPVTIFRKPKQDKVPSEEDQESAVKKMLSYVNKMPSQEKFQPPPVPFVSFTVDESNVKYHDSAIQNCTEADNFTEDKPSSSESIQDYTYLSSEKDVALWKMLVASPTNCNVFVGGLSHDVTSEILQAAFKAFIMDQDDKDQLKAHVVMDVTRQQSKGYGFVTFPCRRSTELAMICMQGFEISGRAMQLGWGQESRNEKLLSAEGSRSKLIQQQQQQQQQHAQMSEKSKGSVVSDTIFSDALDLSSKQSLKRCSSRWDQDTPKKHQRIEESAEIDHTPGERIQERTEEGLVSDNIQQMLPCTGQTGIGDFNSSLLNETVNCTSAQKQRSVQWLTHEQKVTMVKSVCSNLRSCGVRGHLGVFGVHYEADNSRLYVVCAKHVTESQLQDEFTVFGSAHVKLNLDTNSLSKGCTFVQYTESKCAEKAIKQLHGKVVGGMPMKVMVAEPKVRKGSQPKKSTAQL